MAFYSKQLLSGSTNGRQIAVGSSATTIHTAVSGTSSLDEVWIYAVNSDASAVKLTINWGGTTVPNDLIEIVIPAESGYTLVVPGLILQNGLTISAFAATAGVVLIAGYVNRIS